MGVLQEWARAFGWVLCHRLWVWLGIMATAAFWLEWDPQSFATGGMNWLLTGALAMLLWFLTLRRVRSTRVFVGLLRELYEIKQGEGPNSWTSHDGLQRTHAAIWLLYGRRTASEFAEKFTDSTRRRSDDPWVPWLPNYREAEAIDHCIYWIERRFGR